MDEAQQRVRMRTIFPAQAFGPEPRGGDGVNERCTRGRSSRIAASEPIASWFRVGPRPFAGAWAYSSVGDL